MPDWPVLLVLVSGAAGLLAALWLKRVMRTTKTSRAGAFGTYALGAATVVAVASPVATPLACVCTVAAMYLTVSALWWPARSSPRASTTLPPGLIDLVAFSNAMGRTAYTMPTLFLAELATAYADDRAYVLGWLLEGRSLATFAIAVGGLGFAVGLGALAVWRIQAGPATRLACYVAGAGGAVLISWSEGWMSQAAGIFLVALVGAPPQLFAARVINRAAKLGLDLTQLNAAVQSRVTPYTGAIWATVAVVYVIWDQAQAMRALALAHLVLGVLWWANRFVDGGEELERSGPSVLRIIGRRDAQRLIGGILCLFGVYSAIWTPLTLELSELDKLQGQTPAWMAVIGLSVRLATGPVVRILGDRARVNEYRAAKVAQWGGLAACIPLAAAGWIASDASPLARTAWGAAIALLLLQTLGTLGVEATQGIGYVGGKTQIDKRAYAEVVRLATACGGAIGASLAQFLLAPVPPVWSVAIGAGFMIAGGRLLSKPLTTKRADGTWMPADPTRTTVVFDIEVSMPNWRASRRVRHVLRHGSSALFSRPQQVRLLDGAAALRTGETFTVLAGGILIVSYRAYPAAPKEGRLIWPRARRRLSRRGAALAIGDAAHGRVGELRAHVSGCALLACDVVNTRNAGDVEVHTYRVEVQSPRFAAELALEHRVKELCDDTPTPSAAHPRSHGAGWLAGAGLFALAFRIVEMQTGAPRLVTGALLAADAAVVGCALLGTRAAWRPTARLADGFWSAVAAWLLVGATLVEAWRASIAEPVLTPGESAVLGGLAIVLAAVVEFWAFQARSRSARLVGTVGRLLAITGIAQVGAYAAPSPHWALAPSVACAVAVARAVWELVRLRAAETAQPASPRLRASVAQALGDGLGEHEVFVLAGLGTLVVVGDEETLERVGEKARRAGILVTCARRQRAWRTVALGLVASGVDRRIRAWLTSAGAEVDTVTVIAVREWPPLALVIGDAETALLGMLQRQYMVASQ